MDTLDFKSLFLQLTGSKPFPWQTALFIRFIEGPSLPSAADIPTGLGKTSVVVIWAIALLLFPEKVARRLVYVVNRRTVVDQTTAEVERLREKLRQNRALLEKLSALCAVPTDEPLALSTLRGQFADNRTWCADPCRPAVIVGTVDMIGSGLLFSRYTCGFRTRPHHAAFLGQDVLLVHDEAHLEPAFQRLLQSIVKEQARCRDAKPVHVLQLTATARGGEASFVLTPEDERDEKVIERLRAPKRLELIPIADEKSELAPKLIELALGRRESGRAVLVFARSVEVVQKVATALEVQKQKCEVLTGTMRGKERESLIRKDVFGRFLPATSRPEGAEPLTAGTCYLVATSAGEVGVNISAADLICDLSTYESMAQRLGRVNRFGEFKGDEASTITVVHPEEIKNPEPDQKGYDPVEAARSRTLDLLRQLNGDACPEALRRLKQQTGTEAVLAAFTPEPTIRPATDILFDAWAMTSIRDVFPGRPPIAPYLHGEAEWQPPETQVAWRGEVDIIRDGLEEIYVPAELLAEFPLKPHELLRDRSNRVRAELQKMADRLGEEANETRLWVVANDGSVRSESLSLLTDKDHEDILHDATLLLPPRLGGLSTAGLLDGKATPPEPAETLDVAGIFVEPHQRPLRIRIRRDDLEDIPEGFVVKVVIDTEITVEDASADTDAAKLQVRERDTGCGWRQLAAPERIARRARMPSCSTRTLPMSWATRKTSPPSSLCLNRCVAASSLRRGFTTSGNAAAIGSGASAITIQPCTTRNPESSRTHQVPSPASRPRSVSPRVRFVTRRQNLGAATTTGRHDPARIRRAFDRRKGRRAASRGRASRACPPSLSHRAGRRDFRSRIRL